MNLEEVEVNNNGNGDVYQNNESDANESSPPGSDSSGSLSRTDGDVYQNSDQSTGSSRSSNQDNEEENIANT